MGVENWKNFISSVEYYDITKWCPLRVNSPRLRIWIIREQYFLKLNFQQTVITKVNFILPKNSKVEHSYSPLKMIT